MVTRDNLFPVVLVGVAAAISALVGIGLLLNVLANRNRPPPEDIGWEGMENDIPCKGTFGRYADGCLLVVSTAEGMLVYRTVSLGWAGAQCGHELECSAAPSRGRVPKITPYPPTDSADAGAGL